MEPSICILMWRDGAGCRIFLNLNQATTATKMLFYSFEQLMNKHHKIKTTPQSFWAAMIYDLNVY